MFRTRASVAAVILALSGAGVVTGDTMFRSALHDYRVVTVADGLIQPWSIAFLPDGDVLITERPGRLRVMRKGKLLPEAVEGVPKVFHSSQGGLLDGDIYLVTDNREGKPTPILRMEPVERTPVK